MVQFKKFSCSFASKIDVSSASRILKSVITEKLYATARANLFVSIIFHGQPSLLPMESLIIRIDLGLHQQSVNLVNFFRSIFTDNRDNYKHLVFRKILGAPSNRIQQDVYSSKVRSNFPWCFINS